MGLNKTNPIFITGVERSGSALIARIFAMTGQVFTGSMTNMYENYRLKQLSQLLLASDAVEGIFPEFTRTVPAHWDKEVAHQLLIQGRTEYEQRQWMFKHSTITPLWKMWNQAYPNAKWIIVRRKPTEIINSCMKTHWMKLFKDPENREKIGAENEADAWLWWIHQYEKKWTEMLEAGLNCKVVWPDRMADGDYSQVIEIVEWAGLTWDEKIKDAIDPLINKKMKGR